jgi:valyl-tRNA synthetase
MENSQKIFPGKREMDKFYDPAVAEKKWYKFWEEAGFFKPEVNPEGKPYTIILPPPNASGKMHTGNVLMIAIEDLLIRWKRMQGFAALWVPGTDHAGTETQITFEKQLKKDGKSRFNFSREEFYQAIWDFVQGNRGQIESQIRQMGASVDWDRNTFTLDSHVIKTVHATFAKMHADGLVYRGNHIVNYCTKCGTTYADVELKHEERRDPLYYLKYGPFVLATVRPETKFGDTAVAVNPKDDRYKKWVGQEIEVEGLNGKFSLKVIEDDYVDPEFGTGVVKITPAHDKNDYEVGLRHNLEVKPVIDLNGKLNEKAGNYAGLSVFEGRKKVVADLEERGLMDHVDKEYLHTVALCKAGHEIEPMVLPNWFVKVDDEKISFKGPALKAVLDGRLKIYPKWREITYVRWMEEMRDWPISRQNVWGIRIPVWYGITNHESRIMASFIDKNKEAHAGTLKQLMEEGFSFEEIEQGLQKIIVPHQKNPEDLPEFTVSADRPTDGRWIQETDTFDTWFSSGQWPLVTLGYPDSEDFKKFYPTAVLETGWEIIRLWVSRMIMFGIYNTGEIPFKDVYLHGIVRALDGKKMSKSLGNVINPDEYIEQYGVDALRMGLISGTANGKDFNFPKDRVIAFKHFGNKIWNMARFSLMMIENEKIELLSEVGLEKAEMDEEDQSYRKQLQELIKSVDENLEKYRFADAAESIYKFMWHELADKYIESIKKREDKQIGLSNFMQIYKTCLKLLHPFMPFITEDIYSYIPHEEKSIMITSWPTV